MLERFISIVAISLHNVVFNVYLITKSYDCQKFLLRLLTFFMDTSTLTLTT